MARTVRGVGMTLDAGFMGNGVRSTVWMYVLAEGGSNEMPKLWL